MEEKKVTLSNGKQYTIKEIKYKEMIANASEDKEASAKFLLQTSSGLTDEEFEDLGMKDGVLLQKAVNEVNGLDESFLQEAPKKSN